MVTTIGIDQGSLTYDIVGLEQKDRIRPVLEKSFTTRFVKERPNIVLETVLSLTPAPDAVVLPSGFGTRLTKVEEISKDQLFEISLKKGQEPSSLARVIEAFRGKLPNVYVLPSVRLLPTVPRHRRLNRIDMGTSDKVCTAALAIYTQVARRQIGLPETSLVLAELGSSFNAFVAVEAGRIVDGIGGTNSWLGMRARGSIDGEVAALMSSFSKSDAYEGGALFTTSLENGDASPEELASYSESGSMRAQLASDAFIEGIIRDVGGLVSACKLKPKDIFISGRVSRVQYFRERLHKALSAYAPVSELETFSSTAKEGAVGAALVANGLVGGKFKDIVSMLQIREANGSILDDVYLGHP